MTYVYDIECLTNYFLVCFLNGEGDRHAFEISDYQNDSENLLRFLKQPNLQLIGYNNLSYDSQLIEYFLRFPKSTAQELYQYSQQTIESEFPEYAEWKLSIPQLDVFKLNHWNNKAKHCSLKWLQFSIDWHNIEDMPLPHYHHVEDHERDMIKSYCWNDVESTLEIVRLSKSQIDLRVELQNKFKLNLLNSPEPTISKKILGSLLSKEMNIDMQTLRNMRTHRSSINLKDCILPIVSFNEPTLKKVYDTFKQTTIQDTKGSFNIETNFKGIQLVYGLGGIHGAVPGVHKSDDDYIIKSADVTSFYPMLAINNGFKPAHLPPIFSKLYYWFFTERKKYPKSNPLNYVYKIILNSTYGEQNDIKMTIEYGNEHNFIVIFVKFKIIFKC